LILGAHSQAAMFRKAQKLRRMRLSVKTAWRKWRRRIAESLLDAQ
jgi:hypothetical protein